MTKEIKILLSIAALVIVGGVIGLFVYKNSNNAARPVPTAGQSTPSATPVSSELLVRPDSPTLGAPDAKVTIVEFLDPECESCAAFAPTVKQVVSQYEGKARLVIRYMPLHPNSMLAANVLEAAGEQGKYWEMFDVMMKRQPEWGTRHGPAATTAQPDAAAAFDRFAKELGLDMTKLNAVIKESKYKAKVERDQSDGRTVGVRQTPTIFVNGRRLMRLTEAELKSLVETALK